MEWLTISILVNIALIITVIVLILRNKVMANNITDYNQFLQHYQDTVNYLQTQCGINEVRFPTLNEHGSTKNKKTKTEVL